MKPTEIPQQNPEFTPPKEGWLETVKRESFWEGDPHWKEDPNAPKNVNYPLQTANATLDRDTTIAFLANFYAAGIIDDREKSGKPLPPESSGKIEDRVVTHLGRVINKILDGEEHPRYHDEWTILIDKEGSEYHIKITANTADPKDVKTAYERAIQEELVDFDLIKDWNLGKLYEKLDARKAAQ